MRISLVSEHASPLAVLGGVDAGGQNVHVAELASGLAALGAEVVVHTRRDDPSLPRRFLLCPGVIVDHVDAGPPIPIPKDELLPYMGDFARDLARVWRANPPDVVHAHFWMSGIAALHAARPLAIPVAQTFHALGVVKRRHQGTHDGSPAERLALERDVARSVDLVIATSIDETRELHRMGAGRTRMQVVPCGVDLEHFHPRPGNDDVRSDRPRVLVVSRLVERKGIGNVIEAVAKVPDVELVIAGGAPAALMDDDLEARRFRDLSYELGVDDRVDMIGAVPRERIPALMSSADIVVCCPWYEPFGLVALEAMACGVPVVASKVGGLAETVLHGSTGLQVRPRNPGDIAAAITTLLEDEQLRRRMGHEGHRRARRYAWPRIAAETLGHLRRLARAIVATPSSREQAIRP
jgi:glycosyltransferase involved in cell wall biosynthesis